MLKFVEKLSSSLIDFPLPPYTPSLVLFTSGCPLRCPFCFSKHIVLGNTGVIYTQEDILNYIDKMNEGREGEAKLIKSVVLSGGEPLLHHREYPKFLQEIKNRGLGIKMDTTLFGGPISTFLKYLDGISVSLKDDPGHLVLLRDQFTLVDRSLLPFKEIRLILTKENIEAIKSNFLKLVHSDYFHSKSWYLYIARARMSEDPFGEFTELSLAEIEKIQEEWPLKDRFRHVTLHNS